MDMRDEEESRRRMPRKMLRVKSIKLFFCHLPAQLNLSIPLYENCYGMSSIPFTDGVVFVVIKICHRIHYWEYNFDKLRKAICLCVSRPFTLFSRLNEMKWTEIGNLSCRRRVTVSQRSGRQPIIYRIKARTADRRVFCVWPGVWKYGTGEGRTGQERRTMACSISCSSLKP